MRSRDRELSEDLVLEAYRQGFFPMAEHRHGPILWYSPDPRAIIPLESFHIPRSLRRIVREEAYSIRYDTSFEPVMRACAEREDTWISEEIIRVYVRLFEQGHGHSVETWKEDSLVGGLYGVTLGGAFFGESMFSRAANASKIALVALVQKLRTEGFTLLDTQFMTPHLSQFGAREIPREEYLNLLEHALEQNPRFST